MPVSAPALSGRGLSAAALTRPASRAHDDAARHSRRVRRLRFWLPMAGLAAALAIGGWIAWTTVTSRLGLANVLFTRDGVTMVDPHISGRSQGRTYEMVAKRGIQAFDNAKKVRFEEVSGRIEMQDRRWIKVESPIGIFDGTAQTLHLEGGVDVVTSDGYHVVAQTLDLALDKGDMVTNEPVRIETGDGTLTASQARVLDNGHQMLFSGGVQMSLNPKAGSVAPQDDAAAAATSKKETP